MKATRLAIAGAAFCAAIAIAHARLADAGAADAGERHWSHERPIETPPPATRLHSEWRRSKIDSFLLAKMTDAGRSPAPPASREALLRRATLQLTGFPPTLAELDEFLADDSELAYEKAVDRLLASPRFGERMAISWLDLARYADTHGYHADTERDMWRYRDWVIEAINANMPFDEFTLRQLAGDLLPEATLEDKIASGFNRNHMINFEDGIVAEEYRAEYVHDRVATTATVWLGQTLACARCHDHKYEPFTQRDYYRLFAYFNNVPENGIDGKYGNAAPFITAPTRLQREKLAQLEAEIAAIDDALEERAGESAASQGAWEKMVLAEKTVSAPPADFAAQYSFDGNPKEIPGVKIVGQPLALATGKFAGSVLFDGESELRIEEFPAIRKAAGCSISAWVFATTDDAMTIVEALSDDGKRGAVRFELDGGIARNKWRHVAVVFPLAKKGESDETLTPRLFIDGQPSKSIGDGDSEKAKAPSPVGLRIGADFRGMIDELRIYTRQLGDAEIGLLAGEDRVQTIAAIPVERRSRDEAETLRQHYLEQVDAEYRALLQTRRDLIIARDDFRRRFPTTMVMGELATPRETYILTGGDYSAPAEKVEPGVPGWLLPLADDAAPDRLSLAKWLVDPAHPLTARVAVNRYWQLFFATGLVATSDDFGHRGERPTDPELLDNLAVAFVASGWDVKRLVRSIVTSAAYRQGDEAFPRRRLEAESVRDVALFSAGILQEQLGGPSVFPYQPPGLWEELSVHPADYSAQAYTMGNGADLYRRGLYAFWKRSAPPPALVALDAPDRELCTVRRQTSQTPLQSLVLMNDPVLFEAARGMAGRIMASAVFPADRLEAAFRLSVSRRPTAEERSVLDAMYEAQLGELRAAPGEAGKLLSVGAWPIPADLDRCELAALTVVCSAILCLDEAAAIP